MSNQVCNCVEQINKALEPKNGRVGMGITIAKNTMVAVVLVAVEKIDTAKRGKPPSIIATYCPFCGKKQIED